MAPESPNPQESSTAELQKATFGAGCFWGVESTFRQLKGVKSTQVGYIGGQVDHPTYRQVCSDTTGHAEAVEVTFAPAEVSYNDLLEVFWNNHNPTTLNQQGPDFGTQYRSAIFYHSAEQQAEAARSKEAAQAGFARPIVTPAGANTVRARPENATPSVEGPGARHTSYDSPARRTQTS